MLNLFFKPNCFSSQRHGLHLVSSRPWLSSSFFLRFSSRDGTSYTTKHRKAALAALSLHVDLKDPVFLTIKAFLVSSLRSLRKEALDNPVGISAHVLELLQNDLSFNILEHFIVTSLLKRPYVLLYFRAEMNGLLKNKWSAILSMDVHFKPPKGRNAPFVYKFLSELQDALGEQTDHLSGK